MSFMTIQFGELFFVLSKVERLYVDHLFHFYFDFGYPFLCSTVEAA
jgi:hypothetical protein